MKLAIQFGAGAIGRGLLGKVLHDSDYHVLFVDVYQPIVDRINEDGYFTVELSDHDFESQKIDNVSALCSKNDSDLEKIYEKITQAEIITTSVRVENLDSTSKIIAKGLEKKYPDDKKVNIMAFENAYRASDILKEDIIKNVEKQAAKDPRARWVYDNFFNIENIEAYLTGNDPDTIEFVYNMNHNITDFPKTPGQSVDLGRKTPYYLQWDNRWAYDELGLKNIGISGCGPTSTAMVLARIKDDPSITPDKIAKDAKNYMSSEGISWTFFSDEAKKYNLNSKDIPIDEKEMIEALKKGPLIVSVSRGYFTLFGHIFVIDSYENGKFLVNDPNSVKNTMRPWTFEEISDQIAHIWQIY